MHASRRRRLPAAGRYARRLAALVTVASAGHVALAQNAARPLERDSAGIHIVENSARATAPIAFALGDTALLDVSGIGTGRDERFDAGEGYLRGVRLGDGGLAVIDVDRVARYDARGRLVGVTNGPIGPVGARFGYLVAICRTRGDTLLVLDAASAHVGVVDDAGRIVRFLPLGPRSTTAFDFCFGDGTFLVRQATFDSASLATPLRLARLRADGDTAASLGTLLVPRTDVLTQREATLAAAGDRLYVGDGVASEVRVLDAAGCSAASSCRRSPAICCRYR